MISFIRAADYPVVTQNSSAKVSGSAVLYHALSRCHRLLMRTSVMSDGSQQWLSSIQAARIFQELIDRELDGFGRPAGDVGRQHQIGQVE